MKLYFAGPLFTTAERDFNAALAAQLRRAGHEVFLPQEAEQRNATAGRIREGDQPPTRLQHTLEHGNRPCTVHSDDALISVLANLHP
jgi:nucleoside 2-deoxyribosyltransferase